MRSRPSSPRTSTERLRRFAEQRPTSADERWMAEALGRYLAGAHQGLRLEDAFDLSTAAGNEPWWRRLARDRRDALIRDLAGRQCPGEPIARQAAQIAEQIRRYETTAWPRDRALTDIPMGYVGRPKGLLYRMFQCGIGVPTGIRQLQVILSAPEGHGAAAEQPED